MYYGRCCGGCWGRENKIQWWIKEVCNGEGGNGGVRGEGNGPRNCGARG